VAAVDLEVEVLLAVVEAGAAEEPEEVQEAAPEWSLYALMLGILCDRPNILTGASPSPRCVRRAGQRRLARY
jgi:hypothetical protein